jgi:hypothetical protein
MTAGSVTTAVGGSAVNAGVAMPVHPVTRIKILTKKINRRENFELPIITPLTCFFRFTGNPLRESLFVMAVPPKLNHGNADQP